jgi:hypothetical protein
MEAARLTKVCVDIETPLIDRFRVLHPQHGSIKWFFNECLRHFEAIHDPERVLNDIQLAVETSIVEEDE